MAFVKKEWKDRIAEYINRRRLTYEDGSTELVEVARDEGTVSQEGDAFNAETMNNLEERVSAGFEELEKNVKNIDGSQSLNTSILEKALTLPNGVYQFTLAEGSYTGTDLPDAYYQYGNATIYKRNAGVIMVELHGVNGGSRYCVPTFNYYDGNTWSGWKTMATTDDLANYLPLTGGKITGGIDAHIPEDGYASYRLRFGDRDMEIHISASGDCGMYENSFGWIICRRADGSLTLNGVNVNNMLIIESWDTSTGKLKLKTLI